MLYKKTIGLDLRFIEKNNPYSKFVINLVNFFIKKEKSYFYNIYLNNNLEKLNKVENSKIIKTKIIAGSIKDQIQFKKEIGDEDFFIFFNHKIPRAIKKDYILFIPELTKLHFPNNTSFIKKIFENYLFSNSCNNAKKIICFNNDVKEEINDKLNINEEKIITIPACLNKTEKEDIENIKINIKSKYNIIDDFLIYDSGIETEKNTLKLVDVFLEIKRNNIGLSLVILNDDTIRDINFRKKILENNLTDKIFFIGNTNSFENNYFYKNTMGVIFPFLYNVFPFEMEKAMNNNSNILSSNLKHIKNIMGDKIEYFNPNNISSIYEKIIKIKKTKNNYENIFNKYKIDNSYSGLKKLIESL